jgi:hypothetical protein
MLDRLFEADRDIFLAAYRCCIHTCPGDDVDNLCDDNVQAEPRNSELMRKVFTTWRLKQMAKVDSKGLRVQYQIRYHASFRDGMRHSNETEDIERGNLCLPTKLPGHQVFYTILYIPA